jgi:hypothetical protein
MDVAATRLIAGAAMLILTGATLPFRVAAAARGLHNKAVNEERDW